MNLSESIRQLCLLTQQALDAGNNNCWNETKKLLDARDAILPAVDAELTIQHQCLNTELHEQLQILQQLNDELTNLAIQHRDTALQKYTNLNQKNKAILSYLNNSSE